MKTTGFHSRDSLNPLTCSRSLSWWPMIAEAWWGYFCFRCSRKASLFLSMSEGCIARISREPRAPPNVCLRGTVRLPLASPLEGGVPFGEACLRPACSASSGEVTFRLLFVCSEGTEGTQRQGVNMCSADCFDINNKCVSACYSSIVQAEGMSGWIQPSETWYLAKTKKKKNPVAFWKGGSKGKNETVWLHMQRMFKFSPGARRNKHCLIREFISYLCCFAF